VFSKKILEKIGFDVKIIQCIPNASNLISNRLSMQYIYGLIKIMDDETQFYYVFEDDINTLEQINIDEIIQYEAISERFFYLGCCINNFLPYTLSNTNNQINRHDVYSISGRVFGLHAIGMSKKCAAEILEVIQETDEPYIDVILGLFTQKYPANIVRYDLESYINMHRGIIFQDRLKFPSSI